MYKVYIINEESTDNYKIGVTKKDIKTRIKGLASGNPNKLIKITHYETPLGYKLEAALHNYFRSLGKDSKEWFEIIDFNVVEFLKICKNINDNLLYLNKYNSFCKNWEC